MKKASGTYITEDGFKHTVFYDRSKGKYIKIIHNSNGDYCSSAEYTKEQILNQIVGIKKLTQTKRLYVSKN